MGLCPSQPPISPVYREALYGHLSGHNIPDEVIKRFTVLAYKVERCTVEEQAELAACSAHILNTALQHPLPPSNVSDATLACFVVLDRMYNYA